jgi:hypothetical protein
MWMAGQVGRLESFLECLLSTNGYGVHDVGLTDTSDCLSIMKGS